MTPTVPNLAKVVYEQLLAAGVWTTDHAIRVLALHADRHRLTRAQLVQVIVQFEPAWWDDQTIAAAERLLADRGDRPPSAAAVLAYELGLAYGRDRTGPWPPDAPASARCSCGRAPVQWLDGPAGPRTVPYCGRSLAGHHGLEREAAAMEIPPPASGSPDVDQMTRVSEPLCGTCDGSIVYGSDGWRHTSDHGQAPHTAHPFPGGAR